MTYGSQKKKVIFEDTDQRHAQLRIRLRYDGLTQVQFFQGLVTAYLERDEGVVDFIEGLKADIAKFGKSKLRASRVLLDQGHENSKQFGLSESDREELFDMIAAEVGEL